MGNYKSKRDLLYMKPRYFFKYVREHFQLRHLVTPEIMNIQTISETIQNMNGLSYDLVGLERWYLLEKKLPVYCYRLKLNQSPYLTYYFAIFQNPFSGVFYYFDALNGYQQYECKFLGLLLRFILERACEYFHVSEEEYELIRYQKLVSGLHEEGKVSTYLKTVGELCSIYLGDQIDYEAQVEFSNFVIR